MGALRAERARAAGSNPAVAPLVSALLLGHTLLEELLQLGHVEAAERGELLFGELPSHRGIGEPRLDLGDDLERLRLDTAKMRQESLVELVQIRLPVHADRARDVVETVEGAVVEADHERLRERGRLLGADLHLPSAELVQEGDEGGAHFVWPRPQRASPRVTACAS